MNKNKIIVGIVVLVLAAGAVFLIVKKDKIFKPTKKDPVITYKEQEYKPVNDDSIVSTQKNLQDEMFKDFDFNKYSMNSPFIKVNPFEISPLTAVVAFKTSKETKIKITIKGKNNNDLVQEFEKGTEHIIPVYGLYGSYDNKVVISDDNGNSSEITITTENIKEKYEFDEKSLKMEVIENKLEDKNQFYFVTSPISKLSLAFDTYGEMRWLLLNSYKEIEMLENGHILLSSEPIENKEVYNTDLIETDFLGKVYKYYKVENGFHNDYIVLPNKNILFVSNADISSNSGDLVVELNQETGEIVKSINVQKILSDIDKDFMNKLGTNWDFNSGIDFDKDNNAIILSYWYHGTVISIDYDTKKINWMFSNPANWSDKFSSYMLKLNGENEFKYPLSIQAARISNKNNLSMFDNGFDYYGSELCSQLKTNRSSILDYTIDYANKTITLNQRRLQDQNLFSYALGDYDKEYKNDLVLFGREMENVNFSDSKCSIYDHEEWSSYIIELKDNDIVFKGKMNLGSYRISILNFYNNDKNYDKSTGITYKTKGKVLASEKTIDLKDKITNAKSNEENNFELSIMENQVYANLFLPKEEYIDVILVDEYGEGKIFNYKVAGLEENESVVINGLSGRYFIYLDVNGTVFDLKQYIDL